MARKPAATPPTAATTKTNRNLLIIGRSTNLIKKAKTLSMEGKKGRGGLAGAPPT
jgi:hypothetical protein